VKRGDEIALDATISGSPYPTITWIKDENIIVPEEIKKRVAPLVRRKRGEVQEEEPFFLSLTERLSINNSKQGESELRVRDSLRPDHGLYVIKVENDHGVAKAPCTVSVLGKLLKLCFPIEKGYVRVSMKYKNKEFEKQFKEMRNSFSK
jgi:titin